MIVSDWFVPVMVHNVDAMATVVVSTSELFVVTGSFRPDDTEAVFVIVVPAGVPGVTFTTIV